METVQVVQTKKSSINMQIKLYRKSVVFRWGMTSDLKAKLNPQEVLRLAAAFGIPAHGRAIPVDTLEGYNRLLVYAAVRPSLNPAQASELAWLVKTMNSWDAHYWASAFREEWWRSGGYTHLRDRVKAFKLFFRM
ncbi:MAG: hypothetical protein NWF09_09040 [Candidatus Bathyarchaeota archaeon]|nr:hypothetical protein [Candidatus Bathyarchaeota archaeon]